MPSVIAPDGSFIEPRVAPSPLPLLDRDWRAAVPLSYWESAAVVFPPEATAVRDDRLELFHRLYTGDTSAVAEPMAQRVRTNWYRRTAQFIADLHVRTGPELEGIERRSPAGRSVARAAHGFVTDLVRYGTAVLAVMPDGEVVTVDTRALFPAPDGFAVVALNVPADGRATVWTFPDAGGMRIDVRAFEGAGELGAVVGSVTYGGGRRIAVVGRWPVTGVYGESAYADMISLAVEDDRRLSQRSRTLNVHGNPILTLKPAGGPPPLPLDEADDPEAVDEQAQELNRFREEDVAVLPDGFESASYVAYDPQAQATEAHMSAVRQRLLATTGIPAALWGMVQGGTINSGSAIREMQTATWALSGLIVEEGLAAFEELTGRRGEWENAIEYLVRTSTQDAASGGGSQPEGGDA